jgi:hypothetical protein
MTCFFIVLSDAAHERLVGFLFWLDSPGATAVADAITQAIGTIQEAAPCHAAAVKFFLAAAKSRLTRGHPFTSVTYPT